MNINLFIKYYAHVKTRLNYLCILHKNLFQIKGWFSLTIRDFDRSNMNSGDQIFDTLLTFQNR